MPFQTYIRTPRRISKKRDRIHREPGSIRVFYDSAPTTLSPTISISTLSGTLLGSIPTGIQNTILNSIEYTNSERGSDECTMVLSDLPNFPIAVYSKITITLNGEPDYTGYMWKPQDPGNNKNKTFKYEFFGLRQKYKDTPIKTTQDFTISSIAQSGSTSRYNVTTTTAGITTSQMLAAGDCTDDLNNGYRMITAVGSNWFEVTNAVGVNQGGTGGTIRVLPEEWSSSNLVSLLFSQLVQNYGTGLGIEYDSTRIESSTGLYTLGYVDFNGSTLQSAIEMIEKMCLGSYVMGVDREGYYFFKAIPSDIQGVLNVGYQANEFTLTRNFDKIVNVVDIKRSKGKAEGGNGWIIASTGSDATSIAKYGRRQPADGIVTIPEYFSDTVADLIRDSVLSNYKDPKYFASIKKLKLDTIYNVGNYTLSCYPEVVPTIFDEMDSLSGWTYDANVTHAIDTTTLVTGAGSTKFTVSSTANGETATKSSLNFSIKGKETLAFWVRGTTVGQFLNASITDGSTTVNTDVYISTPNEFFYFIWDISNSGIDTITELTFTFNGLSSSQDIWIDEIVVNMLTALQITMPFKKVKCSFKSHEYLQDLELGLQYDKLSEYMQGLQTQIASHNIFLKDKSS